LLARNGALQSMSRWGNCYNNAHAESFWSRFKAELLYGGHFSGLAGAKLEISHHVAYYNAERRHSSRGYLAPTTSNPIQNHIPILSGLARPPQTDTNRLVLKRRPKHLIKNSAMSQKTHLQNY
jgi:putative transposase